MVKIMLSFINMDEVIKSSFPIYAHVKNGEKETLQEHTQRCQNYFQQLYDNKRIEKMISTFNKAMHFQNESASFEFLKSLFIQTITFHDFGKINPKFQRKKGKMNNQEFPENKDYHFDDNHSLLSAYIYIDYYTNLLFHDNQFGEEDKNKLCCFIMEHSYMISRHHSDLLPFNNYINDFKENALLDFLMSHELEGYRGFQYLNVNRNKNIFFKRHKDVKFTKEEKCLKYFYYRLLYSLLVASDYYATSEFMKGHSFDIVGQGLCIKDYQLQYEKYDILKSIRSYEHRCFPQNHNWDQLSINELRSELFLEVEQNLLNHPDNYIYYLEAPTGSGKTNVGMNLSFHLMEGREKLFYIYPYNNLVEQNKEILHQMFPNTEDIVVVNSITPISTEKVENDEFGYQKLYLDRQFLNYPFVLSTHVTLFDMLFGSRKESVIGFHQLSHSVIVLDEIQSYRNEIWSEIIIMLKACAKLLDIKIIIMSATLPHLDTLTKETDGVCYVLNNPQKYFQHHLFKDRVELHYELLKQEVDLYALKEHIKKKQSQNKSVLVEFITKKTAKAFYKMMKNDHDVFMDVLCMTGDDSLLDRKRIITSLKNNRKNVILIATQVVEAGVDIDMDIGYKNISLLDSEEQFLGRISRSRNHEGVAYFFKIDEPHVVYRHDFRQSSHLLLDNEDMQEILNHKDFESYYQRVLKSIMQNRNLSSNENGLDYFYGIIGKLDYPQISDKMKLIDDNQWRQDVVMCRKIILDSGEEIDGWNIWNEYKELLQNEELDYSEKQIKLINVRSELSYFIYSIPKGKLETYNDYIGELICVQDAEKYFTDGQLDEEKLNQESMFI